MPRTVRCIAALVTTVCALIACGEPAHAGVPSTMSYQGQLTNASGVNVPDGTYALTFRLYDALTGGSVLWTETQPAAAVAGGVFAVSLGSVTPLSLAFDQPYWLGVSVGAGSELAPRTPLTASPYALALRTPLPGIAQAVLVGSSAVIGNASTNALLRDLDVAFDVPAPGFVVVQATGHVQISGVPAGATQYVEYQISNTTGVAAFYMPSETGYFQWCGFQAAPNAGYFDWPVACQRTFAVTPGSYRFSFCDGRLGNYDYSASINNMSLIATYYPTQYGLVSTQPNAASAPAGPPR